jgi:copper chaperone CopZ
MSVTYAVEGMTCNGCRNRVAATLSAAVPGATVTLEPPVATFPKAVDLSAVNAALAGIGKYRLNAAATTPAVAVAPPISAPIDLSLPAPSWRTYYPLALIAAYLVVVSFAGIGAGIGHADAAHPSPWHSWMTNFMAGFFLVFSFFKLLDLQGFADAYASYDLVAERWQPWGYLYPLVELGLGLAYLFRVAPVATNLVTLVVMTVSVLGVIRSLQRRQQIRCACLGTVLNLPMSTVTLVEDGLMIAMSAAMLLASMA